MVHGGTRLLDEEEERNSSRSRSRRSGRARQRQIRFRRERQRSPGVQGLRASFSPSVKEALRRVRPYAGQGGRGRRQGVRSKE